MKNSKLMVSAVAAIATCFVLTVPSQGAELVVNGGFETGDLTGWTESGNTGWAGVGGNPHTGSFANNNGAVGSLSILNQDIVTVPGQSYEFNFWVQGDGASIVEATWDGNTVFSAGGIGGPYTEYSFDVVASTALTPISIGLRDDPGFVYLDDVSVQANAVPEPSVVAMVVIGLVVMGSMGKVHHRLQKSRS